MTGLGEAVLVRLVRYGVVWWVLMRRLRYSWRGAVRFGEAVVVGLVGATSGVTWRLRKTSRGEVWLGGVGRLRSGVVWFIPVRLDMAVLIRHEQVRQGGVR